MFLWTGTFGQPDSWDIYKPSTYRHPMVPYDVLIDPMSLPTHPVIEEKQNTQQIIHEGENVGQPEQLLWFLFIEYL